MMSIKAENNPMTEEQKEELRKKQEYEKLGIPVDRLKVCHGLKMTN